MFVRYYNAKVSSKEFASYDFFDYLELAADSKLSMSIDLGPLHKGRIEILANTATLVLGGEFVEVDTVPGETRIQKVILDRAGKLSVESTIQSNPQVLSIQIRLRKPIGTLKLVVDGSNACTSSKPKKVDRTIGFVVGGEVTEYILECLVHVYFGEHNYEISYTSHKRNRAYYLAMSETIIDTKSMMRAWFWNIDYGLHVVSEVRLPIVKRNREIHLEGSFTSLPIKQKRDTK